MSRELDNWISGFLEYSSGIESPVIFRAWAAISTISAALQRKVWAPVKSQRLFPNLYVLLVGPPGVGKGNAIKKVRYWFADIKHVYVAADSLTKRSFYDSLEEAAVENPDQPLKRDNSLFAYIEELGVFLHPGDHDFIYSICHAYDCPDIFQHKTSTAGSNFMENVCFGFVAGVTPKALKDIFTEQAMELGISARTVLVFSNEKINVDIFADVEPSEKLEKVLKRDLLQISTMRGRYDFDEAAAADIVSWVNAGMPPIPQDPRFEHYNVRRFVQFIKLCIIVAAAKRNDLVILPEDVHAAKSVLLEAERVMPQAISSLGANPLLFQQQVAIKYVNYIYETQKRATREAELRRRLSSEVHPTYIDVLLDQLAHAKWLSVGGEKPGRIFAPRGKKED